MSRDKFLFSRSARLYQQAEALAAFLLGTFLGDEEPFGETSAFLEKSGIGRLTDHDMRSRAADLAWMHLIGVAGALDPRFVIPSLLETAEQYYYGPGHTKDSVPWLGSALKTAAAVVWSNRNVAAVMKGHNQVRRLVAAAGAWEQLALHRDQARALEFGASDFAGGGVWLERDEDGEAGDAWNASAMRRGLAHRTLNDSADVIWRSGTAFLDAVSQVLKGERPSRIACFQGTVFEEIESAPEFWLGLSARLQLLAHAAKFRSFGRGETTTGISIFEPFAFATSLMGNDLEKATAVSQAMFWQRDWHARRLASRDYRSNLLVERPAIRIDDQTFVVSLTNIGDSINCFVEHSVFRCFGYGGVPVSEEAFRRRVSQPFEDRTVSLFTQNGWKADHVSDSGTWSGIKLIHPSNAQMPGEIDVLALHPNGRQAVVAECKVLAALFSPSRILNVAQKLGAVDAEGFHRKLEAKVKWLSETPMFKNVELLPLLVVDQDAIMGKSGPNTVVDINALSEVIAKLN